MACAGRYPEPQPVKNAGSRVPQGDSSPQTVVHLAAVRRGDDVVHGAEEGDVAGAVELDLLEGG